MIGVIIGGMITFKVQQLTLRRQESIKKDEELRQRGLSLAGQLLSSLIILSDNLYKTVAGRHDAAASDVCETALREIHTLAMQVPDPRLRARVSITHDILANVDDILIFGNVPFKPGPLVYLTCKDGIDAVSTILRGESLPDELEDRWLTLRRGYEVMVAEKDEIYEAQQQYLKEEAARAREQRDSPRESEAPQE